MDRRTDGRRLLSLSLSRVPLVLQRMERGQGSGPRFVSRKERKTTAWPGCGTRERRAATRREIASSCFSRVGVRLCARPTEVPVHSFSHCNDPGGETTVPPFVTELLLRVRSRREYNLRVGSIDRPKGFSEKGPKIRARMDPLARVEADLSFFFKDVSESFETRGIDRVAVAVEARFKISMNKILELPESTRFLNHFRWTLSQQKVIRDDRDIRY